MAVATVATMARPAGEKRSSSGERVAGAAVGRLRPAATRTLSGAVDATAGPADVPAGAEQRNAGFPFRSLAE